MVRATSVWIAHILTTVSNAKTHQTRPMLVTDLKRWNEIEGRRMKICRICLTGRDRICIAQGLPKNGGQEMRQHWSRDFLSKSRCEKR